MAKNSNTVQETPSPLPEWTDKESNETATKEQERELESLAFNKQTDDESIVDTQVVNEQFDVLDLATTAFREAEEEARNHGYTSEQTFLHLFLPALTAKGLQITAIPDGQQ